jgi:predicted dehydrogenase
VAAPEPDITLAIAGLGYWGPNLLRNASELEGVQVKSICDSDIDRLARQARRYPNVEATADFQALLDDPGIQAVLLATPITTHYELSRRCLEAGKHVFVEKPLASTAEECRELARLAAERGLCLMPGHTFVYSPPVVKMKQLLDSGELGDIYFGSATRVNLGIHQGDASVVRDLAPHDFSILLYWLGVPSFVRAVARASVLPDKLDVAFIDVGYANGCLFHFELSWLAPTKLRRTVLVGSQKMVVYDDTSSEQVRVFDRGLDVMEPQTFGEFQLSYRSGDIWSPRVDAAEPLALELADFAAAIREGRQPRADAELGTQVVRLVEATELSLAHNCAPVWLDDELDGRLRLPDRRRASGGMPTARPR